jgi:undecaprenyl diphosphate synthase
MNQLNHITIIPDGNRRYSRKNKLPIKEGYQVGEQNLVEITEYISDNIKEVKYLTIMGFSYDNLLKRGQEEINTIMELLSYRIDNLKNNDRKYRIRFSVSDEKLLDKDLLAKMIEVELSTKNNSGLCLILQIAYGSRQSLVKSINNLILNNIEITEKTISRELTKSLTSYDEEMPDPNLVIRTSGETRLSNEMLYEFQYTEIFFIEKFWPEFSISDLNLIIESYKKKEIRVGK